MYQSMMSIAISVTEGVNRLTASEEVQCSASTYVSCPKATEQCMRVLAACLQLESFPVSAFDKGTCNAISEH